MNTLDKFEGTLYYFMVLLDVWFMCHFVHVKYSLSLQDYDEGDSFWRYER